MKLRHNLFLAGLVFSLVGCVSERSSGELNGSVNVSKPESVRGCKFVTDLHASSGLYGTFASSGITAARNAVMRQAQSIGATDVVIDGVDAVYGSTTVNASAYKCTG